MRTPLLFTLALLTYVCPYVSFAQKELPYGSAHDAVLPEWTKLMYSSSPDPALVIDAYTAYYRSQPFVKNGHTQYYKRWLRSIGRELPLVKSPRKSGRQSRSIVAQWQSIGPFDWDHDAIDRSYAPGAAHVYTIEQSVSNPDILYAGTATAGIWKSTDRGLSWMPVTDALRTNSVSALEINHVRPQTVFAELLNNIYRTTDEGEHWSATGDPAFQALAMDVYDIVMHPHDTATLYAATDLALFRSTNGGVNWTTVLSGEFLEIEFHPTQTDTIYTVKLTGDKTEFYRSVNNGNSFQHQATGWPDPNVGLNEHQRRTEIAVSPDAPDHVYALATGSVNGGSGLYGVYKSTDAGHSWTFQCCGPGPGGPPSLNNPNLMGWNDDGTDDGGQYYYDLAFAVSPTNADSIYVGGVNLWVSGNGGASFICPAKWSHPYKPNYVHADIHDIRFYPGTREIWLACDGGIFRSSDEGAGFQRRMSGISGTDFWGFGAGYWDGDVMLGGTYHNGTMLKDNDVYLNGWISTDGGDNFRGYVNPGKPKQVYSDYNIKSLSGDRLVKHVTRSFVNKPNASYIVGESSDILFHPQYYGTWYSGSGTKLWKTADDGYTFVMVHDFGANVASMDIARSNPDVLYVCTWPGWWNPKRIYRSDDGGNIWIDITPEENLLGGNTWVPYDIAVDAQDPMKVWIVRTSMYANTDLDGVTVFMSANGGMTWQNITTSALDNEAFTCLIHQAGTSGGVYLGTRESVYYKNEGMSDWEWYGDGLPAATFTTRIIPYYRKGKLRNGTNRSVWESPMFESSRPIAQASTISRRHDCMMDTVSFMDNSVIHENEASWLWEFPGGTPSSSTARNPKVLYSAPGMYDVTLTVTDINGSDTRTFTSMIEVHDWCRLDPFAGRALKCTDHPDYVIVPDLDISGKSFSFSAWVKPTTIQSNYTAVIMSDGMPCGLNFRESNNTLGYHWANSGQAYTWDSNLEVPAGQWSHVAMVVSPTSVKLYLNGQEAIHQIAHPSVNIDAMKIGSYQGWQSRNFNGLIDEVCIWNRSLTLDEIRSLRHLTKSPDDTGLHAYYQFNEETSVVYDKAKNFDAIMNGDATRVKSRAPVGQGISQSMQILTPGIFQFDDVGLSFSFPEGSQVPNGMVYVSRLNVLPDSVPPGFVPMNHGYWIINNYGLNNVITCPDPVTCSGLAFISDAMQDSLGSSLHFRNANAEISGWQPATSENGTLESGISGDVTFTNVEPVFNQLGQIIPVMDSMRYGKPSVAILHASDTSRWQRGGSSIAFGVQSSSKGLLLPRYASATLQNIPSPAEGSIVFVSDLRQMASFDGIHWRCLDGEYLEPPVYDGLPEPDGISLGGGSTASALLSLGIEAGVLVLPALDADDLVQVDFPREGVLIFRHDLGRLQYFDGIDWISPPLAMQTLEANTESPSVSVPGTRIGSGTKDPNALLHIIDTERGLGIPIVRTGDIRGPHSGLIVFDPSLKAVCLFDGVGWKVVK